MKPESDKDEKDAEDAPQTPPVVPEKAAVKEKRPKKRLKVAIDEATHEEENDVEMEQVVEEQKVSQDMHIPEGTLPLFPLPVRPDAPSKSMLAMQGLDQALMDAELVDPNMLLPIPDGQGHGGTMLGEKMRKRLKDLGITELFAGPSFTALSSPCQIIIMHTAQTSLLPFLLPENPFERALYQPYNPPRDVCVSAPTGSGKTLAYVLPIIEVSTRGLVFQK